MTGVTQEVNLIPEAKAVALLEVILVANQIGTHPFR